MIKKNIQTIKTARYFVHGKLSEKTQRIILACHGYAELAEKFIQNFSDLDENKNYVIAPEALHRFYKKGFYGDVGASWMTKDERENEISDYVKYLDKLFIEETSNNPSEKIIKTAFGFSQGTATICRWLINTDIKVDELILWGGPIPNDIDLHQHGDVFRNLKLKIFSGSYDPFISAEQVEVERERLGKHEIENEIIVYEGGHKVKPERLKDYFE